jgi:hypothetical protein
MLVAQVSPLKPAAHAQVNEAMPSEQVAPFMHGAEAHSSMLVSQVKPAKPAAHAHSA